MNKNDDDIKFIYTNGEDYEVDPHAERMQFLRGISDQDIVHTITRPDSVGEHPVYHTMQYTKRIGKGHDSFVLRVAVAANRIPRLIVTVIVLGE